MGSLKEARLKSFYDAYPRIEAEFQAVLDTSLRPRGPELLYELVARLGLPRGARVTDLGCGEGQHSFELARRFGFVVRGIDPVPRHIELARVALAAAAERDPELTARVTFEVGTAEALMLEDATVDLIWCRDVLVHVDEVVKVFAEWRRVLREEGRALVYQWFGTDRLEPHEAEWLWSAMRVVPASMDVRLTEAAIAAAGLRIEQRIELGSEWGERAEEDSGDGGRRLLRAARLLRSPDRYVERFGKEAYEIMLGDSLWHIYRMIGKLSPRAYVLARVSGLEN
jgi:SAM-dependent methyltransferase